MMIYTKSVRLECRIRNSIVTAFEARGRAVLAGYNCVLYLANVDMQSAELLPRLSMSNNQPIPSVVDTSC